ncbi:hypothetical protein ACS0TY_032955 [Phlomoides rotata]
MDRQGGLIVPKCCRFMKKTLQFILLVSFSFFLYSNFSGFPFFSYNLQLSSLIFPLFARALDKKYMFLVCNGIVVFLAKNLRVSSSTGILKSDEDGVEQITELPAVIKEETVRENSASMEYAINSTNVAVAEEQTIQHLEQDYKDLYKGAEETKMEGIILESQELGEKEEEDDDYLEENKTTDGLLAVEEVNEARVSTEELNRKIEEFIRKMKEDIRIEAQQQLITV